MVPEHVLVGQAEMVRVPSVIITTQSTMVIDRLVCQMCVHADCVQCEVEECLLNRGHYSIKQLTSEWQTPCYSV